MVYSAYQWKNARACANYPQTDPSEKEGVPIDLIQQPYEALLRALPTPALLTEHGRAAAWNDAFAALLPGLAPGQPLPEELFPCQRAGASGYAALPGGAVSFRFSPVEGEWLLLTLTPASPRGILSGERWDILAEQLRRELSDLLMAAQSLTAASPEASGAERPLALLQRAIHRMLRMTRHLELMRKPQLTFRPAPLDLSAFCRAFCDEAAPLLRLGEVELTFRCDLTRLPAAADGKLLQLLLLTLLSNAAKAAGKGGTVTLTLSRTRSRAILRLEDSGKGLSAHTLAALFDEQTVPPLTPGSGLGLGLPLARRVTALHHGTLVAENSSGRGLSVVLSLPLEQGEETMPLASPAPDREGGFSPVLVELSDVLPAAAFTRKDVE